MSQPLRLPARFKMRVTNADGTTKVVESSQATASGRIAQVAQQELNKGNQLVVKVEQLDNE